MKLGDLVHYTYLHVRLCGFVIDEQPSFLDLFHPNINEGNVLISKVVDA